MIKIVTKCNKKYFVKELKKKENGIVFMQNRELIFITNDNINKVVYPNDYDREKDVS